MGLALVIGAAAMTFMIVSIDQENAVSSRTVAARNAETALEQLTRDLRQAMTQNASGAALHVNVTTSATTPPTTTISFSIPTPGSDTTPQSVTWTCQGSAATPGQCTRTLGSASTTEVVGYESLNFTNAAGGALVPPVTDPAYLGMTLNVQDTSQLDKTQFTGTPHVVRGTTNPIVVQLGVDLRNEV